MSRSNELGISSGLQVFGGRVTESWITDLRSSGKKVKVFDEISQLDPVGAAMFQTIRMFLQSAEPHVKAAGDLPEDYDKAEFLGENLRGMSKTFDDIIGDIVNFLAYGWMDMEIVYKEDDDGKILWRKWAPRHPITLDKWEFDETGGLQGMWQSWDGKDAYIPIEKLLHFSTTGMGKNNPEGVSMFLSTYTSWFYVKNLSILEAVICERMSGTPVVKMPQGIDENGTEIEIAKTLVRNIKAGDDMGVTLPFGWEFGYEMPSHGPAINIGDVIERHQRDEARTILMDFIMLGGATGSYAMSKDKSSMFITALNTFLDKIAAVINRHGVPRLFDLNIFPGGSGIPTVYFDKITKIDIGDFAEMIGKLFNAGAVTYTLETENQVRRVTGLEQIREPGLMLKPNLPANQPMDGPTQDTKQVADAKMPSSQASMTEFTDVERSMIADLYTSEIGDKLVALYGDVFAGFAEEIADKEEDEWAAIINFYLNRFTDEAKGELAESMIALWFTFVGDRPPFEGYKAILAELDRQSFYLDRSLKPALREALLGRLREMVGATKDLIVEAIGGLVGSFVYRVRMYANAMYTVFANHASSYRALLEIRSRYPAADVEMDWDKGILDGDDVLARNVSMRDERVCPDCQALDNLGWTDPANISPIGSRLCGGNDRCYIEYKVRGRVF
jgi:phage gp29-like protein